MLVTRKQVESNLGKVTPDQIARCTKVYDFQLRANIYMVLSESDDLTEYRVTYDQKHGCFCCACPSGEKGFSGVRHASGVCKHVRWACAAAAEEKATETRRLERAVVSTQLESVGLKPCSTLDCLQTANPATGKCVAHKPVREHLLIINGQEASDEEYNRVMNAKPAKVVKHGCYQPKAFSIL